MLPHKPDQQFLDYLSQKVFKTVTEPYILFAAFVGQQPPVHGLEGLLKEMKENTPLGQKAYSRLYQHFGKLYEQGCQNRA